MVIRSAVLLYFLCYNYYYYTSGKRCTYVYVHKIINCKMKTTFTYLLFLLTKKF